MAITKAKRSERKAQLAVSTQQPVPASRGSANPKTTNRKANSSPVLRRRPRPTTTSNKLRFPEAKGRVVEFIEFFSDASSNSLHLRFQDNTSLTFDFATSFATEAFFSRWKAGNERVLRYWPRLHPEPVF